MNILVFISNITVPLIFVTIISYGYLKKIEIYDVFIDGAKDGIMTVFKILPTLVGLMVAVGILRASGALEFFSELVSPVAELIGFPSEAVPLSVMRLVSSSASLGLALDLFKQFGPDSFIGRTVSIMIGCTETVFYTVSVYFMSVGIKKTRYTIPAAVFVNIAGAIISFYVALRVFGR